MKNYNLTDHLSRPMKLSTEGVGFHIDDKQRTVVDIRSNILYPRGTYKFSDFFVGKVIDFYGGDKSYPLFYIDSVKLINRRNTVRLELKKINLKGE